MEGFLVEYKRTSSILVPFFDTLIAGNTRDEEAAYILSTKYLFILELFEDLYPISSNKYLCCVDSIKFIGTIKFWVVKFTVLRILLQESYLKISYPPLKQKKIHHGLYLDKSKNVLVTLEDSFCCEHTELLKENITRNKTLGTIKNNS